MHPLHHYDDGADLLVVQTGQDRICHPFIDTIAPYLRQGVDRLERIVNDDQVAAPPGKRAAHRSRKTEPAMGELDFALAVFEAANAGVGKGLAIPGTVDGRPEII